MNILFICTANICRSFMAERIMKKKLGQRGITRFNIFSAGTQEMNSHPADPRAENILEKHGFEGAEHKSRIITRDLIIKADLILVMENVHKRIILEGYPETAKKIFLLKSFQEGSQGMALDIKDPYRLSDYHYRQCLAELIMSIDGFMKHVIDNKTTV